MPAEVPIEDRPDSGEQGRDASTPVTRRRRPRGSAPVDPCRASAASGSRRLRRGRLPGLRRPAGPAHGGRRALAAPSPSSSRQPVELDLCRSHRRRRPRRGPGRPRRRPRPDVDAARLVRSVNAMLGAGRRGPVGRGRRRPDSTPAGRPGPGATATWSSRTTTPTRSSPRWPGTSGIRSTCGPWRAAADALLGEHDFRAFCRPRPGDRSRGSPSPGGCSTPAGTEVPVGPGELGPGARLLRFDIEATVVLSSDGPLDRGHPGRGGPGPAPGVGRDLAPRQRQTGPAGADPAPPQGLCLWPCDYAGADRPHGAADGATRGLPAGRLPGAYPASSSRGPS